jgi:hypothetical protein
MLPLYLFSHWFNTFKGEVKYVLKMSYVLIHSKSLCRSVKKPKNQLEETPILFSLYGTKSRNPKFCVKPAHSQLRVF